MLGDHASCLAPVMSGCVLCEVDVYVDVVEKGLFGSGVVLCQGPAEKKHNGLLRGLLKPVLLGLKVGSWSHAGTKTLPLNFHQIFAA